MTVSVRPWPEISADLYEHVGGWGELTWEAAVAGDALAAENAKLRDELEAIDATLPDCSDGKVTVAQLAALWERVWDPTLDSDPQYPSSGKLAIVGQLRGVW